MSSDTEFSPVSLSSWDWIKGFAGDNTPVYALLLRPFALPVSAYIAFRKHIPLRESQSSCMNNHFYSLVRTEVYFVTNLITCLAILMILNALYLGNRYALNLIIRRYALIRWKCLSLMFLLGVVDGVSMTYILQVGAVAVQSTVVSGWMLMTSHQKN